MSKILVVLFVVISLFVFTAFAFSGEGYSKDKGAKKDKVKVVCCEEKGDCDVVADEAADE